MVAIKRTLFFIFLICIVKSGYSSIYEPSIDTVYSENKIYKVIISPLFCNKDSCLPNSYKLSYLNTTIDSDFRKQQIFSYKQVNDKYQKINIYEVPVNKFFFSGGYNTKLSNDGTKVMFFNPNELYGAIINMKETVNIVEFNVFSDFNLSPSESVRLNEELRFKEGKSKILVKLTNDRCTIRLCYYNEKGKRYLNKKRIFYLK